MKLDKQVVLIVEDQQINRTLLRKILENEYDVVEADNGKAALDILSRQNDISAILLDINMPVMNGYEFLTLMPKTEYSSLPVIAVTASKDHESEQKVLDLGAWDFISKPYEPKILLTRLKNVIVRSQFYLMDQMRHVYEHDSLTDLYKRRTFFLATRKQLDDYPDTKFVLLRFDIDNFHLLNSFWGEEEGNRFLCYLADGIREMAKSISPAVYGRISADTFCACFPYDREFIKKCLQHTRESLASYNRNYLIKPSMGVYVIEDPSEKIETMYEYTTLAARECKKKYETYLAYYSPEMSQRILEEQAIVNEMQRALEEEQFEVYLQPKYNLETEQPYGAEALIRWRHPVKGLISPGVFIPVFEQNGFIGKIDRYMWEKVCVLLRRWVDEGKKPAPISVNVSRINMYNPNLVSFLTGLIAKYHIDAGLLNLELTESAYMEDPDLMKKTVISLQEAGFTVMMDDFGSGYSSLNTLKDIPVNVLKIDMKFLSGETSAGRNECILASVIRMAGWLGIPVIMEGVETEEQIRFLKSTGCGYVQGYYYARPMPVADYDRLLNDAMQRPATSESENHELLFQTVWSEDVLNNLFFNSFKQPAGIYEVSTDEFHILKVNAAFSRAFGYGHTVLDDSDRVQKVLINSDFDALRETFRSVIKTQQEQEVTLHVKLENKEMTVNVDMQYWGKIDKSFILFVLLTNQTDA